MKNAGMAGAVALVGIGLIAIGQPGSAARANEVQSRHAGSASLQGDCTSTVQEDWFQPIARPLCLNGLSAELAGALPYISTVDVNGDGRPDRVFTVQAQSSTSQLIWASQLGGWSESPIMFALSFDAATDSVRVTDFSENVRSAFDPIIEEKGITGFFVVNCLGTADIDGDQRVDLIVETTAVSTNESSTYWLPNIGAAEPLVADINRDGFVNAEDLGLLIASWTG